MEDDYMLLIMFIIKEEIYLIIKKNIRIIEDLLKYIANEKKGLNEFNNKNKLQSNWKEENKKLMT